MNIDLGNKSYYNSNIFNKMDLNQDPNLINDISYNINEFDCQYIENLEKIKSFVKTLISSIQLLKYIFKKVTNQISSKLIDPKNEDLISIIERINELFSLFKFSLNKMKNNKKDIINQIIKEKEILYKIVFKNDEIKRKINKCILKLQNKLFYEKIETTEKNLIQSALILGSIEKENINHDLDRNVPINDKEGNHIKNIKFNSEFIYPDDNKISKSYLYLDKSLQRCKEPVFNFELNLMQFSLVKLKYPEEDLYTKNPSNLNEDFKIKFVETSLANIKDEDIVKQPCFCNGIEYSKNNISNVASFRSYLQKKFNKNLSIYTDKEICTIFSLDYFEEGIIIYETLLISAISYSKFNLQSGIISETFTPILISIDDSLFDDSKVENKIRNLKNLALIEGNVIREEINLVPKNNNVITDIQPIMHNYEENSRPCTDGSFYQTSLYHRNSINLNIEDEDGI